MVRTNESTPIDVKLQVLDTCMFISLLYGSETWGDFSSIYENLRKIERKVLKAILKVKKGTTNDLIYHELRRADIVAKVKDRQFQFFNKITKLQREDAIVKVIYDICEQSDFVNYYKNLHNHNVQDDISRREEKIRTSNQPMIAYYRNMNFENKSCIYNSYLNDDERSIITRWRLSNHDLKIETERYKKPKIERELRVCDLCEIMEDETHVLMNCPRYDSIRVKYEQLMTFDHLSVLNPTRDKVKDSARLLHEIQELRKTF